VLKAGAKGSLQLLFEGNEGQDIASYGSLFCVLAGPDSSLCVFVRLSSFRTVVW
jgi:hypothetical protein